MIISTVLFFSYFIQHAHILRNHPVKAVRTQNPYFGLYICQGNYLVMFICTNQPLGFLHFINSSASVSMRADTADFRLSDTISGSLKGLGQMATLGFAITFEKLLSSN